MNRHLPELESICKVSDRCFLLRLASIASALFFVSLTVYGQDAVWPQFRGPDSNPVGTNVRLPDRWSKTENIEWSQEIPGRGWSSPIVSAGKVFVTTVTTDGKSKSPQVGTDFSNEYVAELMKQGLSEQQVMERVKARDIEMPSEVATHFFLCCLDLQSGSMQWQKEFYSGQPPVGRHRKNSFASETPVTDGQLIYVYSGSLGIYAYHLDGKQAWAKQLESQPYYLDWGTGGSPVLHKNQLVILSDNAVRPFIAAYDKGTGELLWRTDRNLSSTDKSPRRSGWTTPFVWSNQLRTEIVTIGPGMAASYDLKGKELWRLSDMSTIPVPSPFAYDGLLYLDGGQTRPLFAIAPGGSGDISKNKPGQYVVWSQPRAGTYLPTPVAYEGHLYVLDEKGILSRFDAKTGKISYKERVAPPPAAFTSSPWAYNGNIFCLSEQGKTYVITTDETFKLLRINALDGMALATPALSGDRLLIRTEGRLYSIRQKR